MDTNHTPAPDMQNPLTAADLLNNNVDELNAALTGGWMRVKVTVRKWDDSLWDDILSDELKRAHGVVGDRIGGFRKNLLGDYAFEYRAMNSALAAVRTTAYRLTQQLARDYYVAPLADMPNVIKDLTAAKKEADACIQEFGNTYNQRVGEAQQQLGSMASSLEYPSCADVLAKIGVDIAFEPLPDIRTFKGMALPAGVAASFAAQVGNQQRDLVTNMVSSLYDDLVETTADIANALGRKSEGEKGVKLTTSKIDKIKRLARQLESAKGIVHTDFSNLTDAVNMLADTDFDAAKNSIGLAGDTAQVAQRIADTLKGMAPANMSAPTTPTAQPTPIIAPEQPTETADNSTPTPTAPTAPTAQPTQPEPVQEPVPQPPEQPATDPNDPFADLDALFF